MSKEEFKLISSHLDKKLTLIPPNIWKCKLYFSSSNLENAESWLYSDHEVLAALVMNRSLQCKELRFYTSSEDSVPNEEHPVLLFQTELYIDFGEHLRKLNPQFVVFEFLKGQVGLSFINESTASSFYKKLQVNAPTSSQHIIGLQREATKIGRSRIDQIGTMIGKPKSVQKVGYLDTDKLNPAIRQVCKKMGISKHDLRKNKGIADMIGKVEADYNAGKISKQQLKGALGRVPDNIPAVHSKDNIPPVHSKNIAPAPKNIPPAPKNIPPAPKNLPPAPRNITPAPPKSLTTPPPPPNNFPPPPPPPKNIPPAPLPKNLPPPPPPPKNLPPPPSNISPPPCRESGGGESKGGISVGSLQSVKLKKVNPEDQHIYTTSYKMAALKQDKEKIAGMIVRGNTAGDEELGVSNSLVAAIAARRIAMTQNESDSDEDDDDSDWSD